MTQVTRHRISEGDARLLALVTSRLDRLLHASERIVSDAVAKPVSGSLIATASGTDLRDAYGYVPAVMFSAEDHFRTILLVIKGGLLPAYALYTLLRAAAEAILRCRHLLDPSITEVQRLARSLNERLHNLNEQNKVSPETLQGHYEERLARLQQQADAYGITVRRRIRKDGLAGKILGFDEPVKRDIDFFNTYLDSGSLAYRFLCGHAHSMTWVQLSKSRAIPSDDPGMALVATDLNIPVFAGVMDAVLDQYNESLGYWLVLGGYPIQVLRDAIAGS
jgi:hypothetical protein